MRSLLFLALPAAMMLAPARSAAQVSVTAGSLTYTQNFNSFAGSAATLPAGWTATGSFTYRGTGNGSSNAGGSWAYGNTGEYALGYLGSGSATSIQYRATFVNNTGSAITALAISFDFEQWRVGGGNTQGFTVTGLNSLASSSLSTLNTSSCSCGSTGTATVTPKSLTLTGLSIPNGSTYGIQWAGSDGAGTDNGIAIDNFSITATIISPCTPPTLAATPTAVSCFGGLNGAVDLTPTGGVTPYTYSWTGPSSFTSTNQDISGLRAGTYSVTVTGDDGCTATRTVSVAQPSDITLNAVSNSPVCLGDSLGLSGSASGGSGSFSYSWTGPNGYSANSLNNFIDPAAAGESGTYMLHVTDANGCHDSATVAVLVNGFPVIDSLLTDVSCFGAANGSVDLTISGATGPFTYAWSGPSGFASASQDITALTSGVYNVTVTAAGGCTSTQSFNIQEPADMIVFGTASSLLCTADSLVLAGFVTGGTGALTYSWSGPNGFLSSALSDSVFSVSIADSGDYKFIVTDINNCKDSVVLPVVIHTYPVLSYSVTDATCFGGSNGEADITVTGGTAPFIFGWNGPAGFSASTEDITGLIAGTYTPVVTGTGGCTTTGSVAVNEPQPVVASVTGSSPVCTGDSLGFSGSATGGTGAYSYSWSGPGGFSSSTQDAFLTTAASSATGTYMLIVSDVNSCTDTVLYDALVNTFAAISSSISDVSCNGSSDGAVDITASGSAGPFAYSWSGPGGFLSSLEDVTGVVPGTYTVSVTAAGGCISVDSVIVGEPAVVSATANAASVVCEGGMLTLNGAGTGGTGSMSYSWSGPGSYNSAQAVSVVDPFTTGGYYVLQVTDANGCSGTDSVQVTVDPLPSATGINVVQPASNSFTFSVNGGSNITGFEWEFGDGTSASGVSSISHTYGAEGTYIVLLILTNGCGSDTATTQVTVAGTSLPGEDISAEITVYPNPATEVLFIESSFTWKEIRISDLTGRTVSAVSGMPSGGIDVSALTSGTYILILTDNSGKVCTKKFIRQ